MTGAYFVGIVCFLAFVSMIVIFWTLPVTRDCTPIRHDWNRSRGQPDLRLEPPIYYRDEPVHTETREPRTARAGAAVMEEWR